MLELRKSIMEGFILIWSKNGLLFGLSRLSHTILFNSTHTAVNLGLDFMSSAFYAVLSTEHTKGAGWEEQARGIETGVLHMTFTPCSPALRIHPPICKAIPERLSSRNRCQLILCPYVQHLLVTHVLLLQGFAGSWMLESSDTLWTANIPADAPAWWSQPSQWSGIG